MKKEEIIRKLEEKGYEVFYGKYEYWDSIPYVEHEDGKKTFLAKTFSYRGSVGVDTDVSFKKILDAIERKSVDINALENEMISEKIEREAEELAKKYS